MKKKKNVEIVFDDINIINKWKIEKLKDNLNSKDVTWFLGAGISVPFNIPLWDELLKRMWTRLTDANLMKKIAVFKKREANTSLLNDLDNIEKSYHELMKKENLTFYQSEKYKDKLLDALKGQNMEQFDNLNLLQFAEYINNMLIEGQELPIEIALRDSFLRELTRDSLYASYHDDEDLYVKEKQAVGVLAEYLLNDLKEKKRVITYNYDEVLEKMLIYKGGKIEKDINIISQKTEILSSKENIINLYHVHGFLPKSEELKEYESKSIVLAESSYDEIEKYAYNWVNTIQANAFHTSVGVFLGFSGQDHNFRRILKNIEVIDRKDPCNFMFVAINSFIEKCKELGDEGKTKSEGYNFEKRQLIDYMHAQETYWEKYNIYPIWTTYEQLPLMLEEILKNK